MNFLNIFINISPLIIIKKQKDLCYYLFNLIELINCFSYWVKMMNSKIFKVISECWVKTQSLFNKLMDLVIVIGFKWIAFMTMIFE